MAASLSAPAPIVRALLTRLSRFAGTSGNFAARRRTGDDVHRLDDGGGQLIREDFRLLIGNGLIVERDGSIGMLAQGMSEAPFMFFFVASILVFLRWCESRRAILRRHS